MVGHAKSVGRGVPSSLRTSLVEVLNPAPLLRGLWRHRDLTLLFIKREILRRNKGTSLGIAWSILVPLLLLAVYAFVFGVVFQTRWGRGEDAFFVLPMFCGMTLFSIFAECVTRAPELVLENPSYVKRVVFPLEILPVSVLGAAVALSTVNVAILVAGVLLTRHTLPPTVVFFPLMLLPLVMLSLGLAWFFASLGVFLRDVKNVVAIGVSPVLFFLSPVFYPIEQLPERYQALVRLNPLTTILEGGRQTLIWGESPDWAAWAVVTLLGWIVMQLGWAWFMKTKRGFADVV